MDKLLETLSNLVSCKYFLSLQLKNFLYINILYLKKIGFTQKSAAETAEKVATTDVAEVKVEEIKHQQPYFYLK